MSARAWLQAFRIHTASLTIPGTLLGVAAAGHLDLTTGLAFGAWAVFFHSIGFLHNNLCDLEADRLDPSKKHFPLVTGAVDRETAAAVFLFGTILLWFFGLALTWPHVHGVAAAALTMFFLATAIVAGMVYNSLAKQSLLAPLFISMSFASLPAFAYFASGGPIEFGAWTYIMAYGFAMLLCQIAWSGYYKDLESDPVNLLRSLGVRHYRDGERDAYTMPLHASIIGLTLRALCPLLAILWVPPAFLVPTFLLAALTVVTFAPLVNGITTTRRKQVRWMGLSEISAYWLLLASLLPMLGGWLPFAAWALLPLGWFVFWNRVLWGTLLAPRV